MCAVASSQQARRGWNGIECRVFLFLFSCFEVCCCRRLTLTVDAVEGEVSMCGDIGRDVRLTVTSLARDEVALRRSAIMDVSLRCKLV